MDDVVYRDLKLHFIAPGPFPCNKSPNISWLYNLLTKTDLQRCDSIKIIISRSIIEDRNCNVNIKKPCHRPKNFFLLKINKTILNFNKPSILTAYFFKLWTFYKIILYWTC